MTQSVPRWHAELVLVGITLIWGGTFAIVKEAVVAISPFLFTGVRFLLALALVGLVWRGSFHRWHPHTLRHGLLLGLLLSGGFLLQTLGLQYTTASRSAFITGATVALVPLFQLLLQRRPVAAWEWLGAAMTLVGLWQLSNPELGQWNPGDLLTVASTLFWATYIVVLDTVTRSTVTAFNTSVQLTFVQFAVVACAGLATYGIVVSTAPPGTERGLSSLLMPTVWVALAYTAVLASLIAMLAQTHYQRFTTPVRATLLYSLEPVFASAIAWGFLGERLTQHEFVGAGLILVGIAIAQFFGIYCRS